MVIIFCLTMWQYRLWNRVLTFICLLPSSCRFALVCVGSEASSRKLMELLSKRELHGQNPIVTPCNKQSLSQFEMQSRKSKKDKHKHGISIFKNILCECYFNLNTFYRSGLKRTCKIIVVTHQLVCWKCTCIVAKLTTLLDFMYSLMNTCIFIIIINKLGTTFLRYPVRPDVWWR